MSLPLVIFFHRLGIKLFEVPVNEDSVELVEITSVNPPDIIENLSEYSEKEVYLLVSDAICNVFHHELPRQEGHLSREYVFEQVKDKFPNHLQSSNWDFKIISTDTHTIEIIVFALNSEFQTLISRVISKLNLKVIAIEPESIAVTRHSNPVIGITFGKVIQRPAEKTTIVKSMNTSEVVSTPAQITKNTYTNIITTIIGLVIFILINIFLYQKYNQTISNPTSTTIPTANLTPAPTSSPTPIIQKTWSSLSLLIENGTTKAGYAGSIAVKFEEEGIINVKTSNASRNDYSASKLTFKSSYLKDSYFQKFNKIFPISESNSEVNTDLETDIVLTLGTL